MAPGCKFMSESRIPRAAWILGLAGLLPSIASLAAMLAWPEADGAAAKAGLAYAAVIAGVVGGTWLGLAASRATPAALPRYLAISAVPGLVGWLAALTQRVTGFAVLAFLFAVLPATDRRLMQDGVTPGWSLGLRRPLSYGMAALLAAKALLLASRMTA